MQKKKKKFFVFESKSLKYIRGENIKLKKERKKLGRNSILENLLCEINKNK